MKNLFLKFYPKKAEVEQHIAEVEEEIQAAKKAKKQVKHALIEKNEQLQQTIHENHFTMRIHRATGGKLKGART